MKSRVAILVYLAGFSLAAGAMPHASLNQLVQQSDPDCTQAGTDNGFKDLIQQVNLFSRQNPNPRLQLQFPNEPRGTLKDMAPYLNLTKHEKQLRQVVGDLFCPGISSSTQGTATLMNEDGTLITNAHLFVQKSGKNKEALSNCFWQRKGSTEHLAIDVSTFKPLTRDFSGEFYKDLSIVRLRKPLLGVRPIKIEDSDEPMKEGDQYIMVSATQKDVPGVAYTTQTIPAGNLDAEFVYSSDLIVQSCTNIKSSNGIWGDCSAEKGSSGSGIFILRGDEILFKGVHKAGGRPSADHKAFTLDDSAPGGKSYSYEIQLNRQITSQIETLLATNDKGRTSLGEHRASLDPK